MGMKKLNSQQGIKMVIAMGLKWTKCGDVDSYKVSVMQNEKVLF